MWTISRVTSRLIFSLYSFTGDNEIMTSDDIEDDFERLIFSLYSFTG